MTNTTAITILEERSSPAVTLYFDLKFVSFFFFIVNVKSSGHYTILLYLLRRFLDIKSKLSVKIRGFTGIYKSVYIKL